MTRIREEEEVPMVTCQLCGYHCAVSYIHRQLIWQGSICVHLQDIGTDLSRSNLEQTTRDTVVHGLAVIKYGQLHHSRSAQ